MKKTALLIAAALLTMGTVVLTTVVTINSDGNATTPVITMGTTPDSNTGIFHPAADTIGFTEGGTETVRMGFDGLASHLGVLDTAFGGGFCITQNSANLACSTSASGLGLFFDSGTIDAYNAGARTTLTITAAPLILSTSTRNIRMDNTTSCGTFTGESLLNTGPLVVGACVASSTAKIQTDGLIASSTPTMFFAVGPYATQTTTGTVTLGKRNLSQRVTIDKAYATFASAGTGGSAAMQITITDGSGTCTLTQNTTGCNAAINTLAQFTNTGTCAFASGPLTFSLVNSSCTVAPTFLNISVDVLYQ